MTDLEMAKAKAIQHFQRRCEKASATGQIENQRLHAGSAMFFYCTHCGIQTDCLPEDYLFPPHSTCSQCEGLTKEGWLRDAIRATR